MSSCRKEEAEDPDVLAWVAEQRIGLDDVLAERDRRRAQGRPVAGGEELLAEMIDYQRLLEYAKLRGIDEDPEFRRSVDNLLIGTLKQKELTAALDEVVISDEELKAEYEARRESLTKPGALRFSIIKVTFSPRAGPGKIAEAKARIDAARELGITGDAGFQEAAVRASDDQASRYRGGDIGWNEAGTPRAGVPDEVLDAGHRLGEDGALSEVIRVSEGFYLIKRTDSREPSVPTFDEVEGRLKSELVRAKRESIQKAFEEKVASAIEVRRFPERLEDLDFGKLPPSGEDRPPENP